MVCGQSVGVNWYRKRHFKSIPDIISESPSDLINQELLERRVLCI